MADIIRPDLCVIGAGALGIDLALLARQRGLDVVLVDIPGTDRVDPAQGSLRRAAFLASAARAHAIRTADQVGLDTPAPKPNFRAITEHAAALAATAAPRDAVERLAALGVITLEGAASFVDQRSLRCGDTTIRAGQFALATGAQSVIPALLGLDDVPYFTPETIADNIRKLSHLVVIGGSPQALELAQAYRRLGSMVTIVPQGGMLAGFEPELVAILLQILREEGIVIRDDAEVTAIVPRSQGTGVTLHTPAGEDGLDVSHILVAMGRAPVLDARLLDKLKLRRDRLRPDHLLVGSDGQTSNGRVSAIGGAAGQDHPHVAARQAGLLVERLVGQSNGRLDPHKLPRFVATEPALAQLGTFAGDKPLRAGQSVLRANLAETDAARAMGQMQGAVRLVIGSKGTITGAGAVGPGVGEIIAMLALAVSRGLTPGDLAHLALPQSSIGAALLDLAARHLAQQERPGWKRRLPGLARFLP
ncbi:FAD-dependent oxidoreductase [Devosia ginsengisoli]|uniref:FAD-dependent oxidoreductase n=1 Tax=Devosia ginsengisoli TaxID=400770 RepID=UPI0026F1A9BF|nr:FAD-dependent oxidoreductase [Devosia ginsengisoli]MCR6670022.1 FAD-dependent oxidoreductase [Devosia ginsengisoli]